MRITHIHSNWRFRQESGRADFPQIQIAPLGWLPAWVPGSVHSDLVQNGVIADPKAALHEHGAAWIDHADWTYETEFEWHPHSESPHRVLRFEGLDTVADIVLNGSRIDSVHNMFTAHEFDVSAYLQNGLNKLSVTFRSAVDTGIARRREYFEREGLDWQTKHFDERAFVRKAQFMSGWDWGPRLVGAGIWKSVALIEFRSRLKDFWVRQQKRADGRYEIWAEGEHEGEPSTPAFSWEGSSVSWGDRLTVSNPVLWWPNGEGNSHLYRADVEVAGHRQTRRVGLRTIELDRSEVETEGAQSSGREFRFIVNGRALWARGANWIPDDSYVCDAEGAPRIANLKRLGFNMLRVWGGGLYESDAFYDACDEAGILVWQDFPFACSFYPDDEAIRKEIREEAEQNVRRIRGHASHALWCGNNENETMWQDRWAGDATPPRYYGEALYALVLPTVINALDPDTPYIRTSPLGLTEGGKSDQEAALDGDSHYWDVWHGRGDWMHYQDSHTRFSSEYGFASACGFADWAKTFGDRPWELNGEIAQSHDKTNKTRAKFRGYVELHYPPSETIEDWTYYSQLNQRDALRCAIEHYRTSDVCSGSLIWQLNDCWPTQSWSVEDHSRHLKIAGHELARLYAHVLIAVKAGKVWVINHGPLPITTELWVNEDCFEVALDPGEMQAYADMPAGIARLHLAHNRASETWRWPVEPKALTLPAFSATATYSEGTIRVQLQGFAAELVLWDPDQPGNLTNPITGRAGLFATSGQDLRLSIPCRAKPNRLRLRALNGVADLKIH